MIKVHGGGEYPALGQIRYPRAVQKTWKQVEISKSLFVIMHKGTRQPIVESRIVWRELNV